MLNYTLACTNNAYKVKSYFILKTVLIMVVISDVCPLTIKGAPGNAFLTLINALFLSKCSLDSTEELYQKNYAPSLSDGDVFDFIVIGAGSAGSVVANRLSENPNWKILVLEAGGYPTHNSEIPAFTYQEQLTKTDWAYKTEPSNKACLGLKNKTCLWPRGKVLGGSSTINGMLYVRGHCSIYDEWEELGNPGWNCKNATHYFIKSENVQWEKYKTRSNHGVNGYLSTSYNKPDGKIRTILLNAAEEAGIKIGDDEITDGFYEALMTTENGRRCNAAKAFLSKVKHRKNLFVATNTLVTKLIIDNKKATGVVVEIGKNQLKLQANNEVILSGGSINSPQLLQLSSIGPKDFIKNPIVDLPVGKNLMDHVGIVGVILKFNQTANDDTTQLDEIKNIFKYYTEFKGPFSKLGIANIMNFFNTKNTSDIPNIQNHYSHFPSGDTSGLKIFLDKIGCNEVTKKSLTKINEINNLLLVYITLLDPKSRGLIKLRSNDPHDKPIIHNGYFEDKEDLYTLLDSLNFVRTLLKTKEFQKYNTQLVNFDIPNCKNKTFDTKDYWECNFRNFAVTVYHPAGTCKMGPATDSTTVVDSRLKVHGISNLRVIDLSITPTIPRGNTNAPAIMIGEKGADLIKEDWGFTN